MSATPQITEKDLGKDLKTFEQLPARTKELELLMEQTAKATGQESVDLQGVIRDKAKRKDESLAPTGVAA